MSEPVEFVCYDDTLHDDPALYMKYGGEFVAAADREIIAHGSDPDAVGREAAAKLGVAESAVSVWWMATVAERIAWEWR